MSIDEIEVITDEEMDLRIIKNTEIDEQHVNSTNRNDNTEFEYTTIDKLNFNYVLYQHNILMSGFIGTGKTTLAQDIIREMTAQDPEVFAWDPQDKFGEFGDNVKTINDIQNPNGSYILNPIQQSQEYFDKYFQFIYSNARNGNLKNKLSVVDELQLVTNPQDKGSPLFNTVTSCRNQGISHLFITPSPAFIPKFIKENVMHVFCFMMNDYDHVEYMERNFFGKSAWLVLSPDKRKYYQDEPILPPHSFIYRNQQEQKTQVVIV